MHATPPSESTLARAAELRAAGNGWEVVATQLNRSAETIRKWPRKYAARWRAALHDAERRLAADAGGESLLVLRQLLRSDDDKIRWQAARSLIHLHLELARMELRAAALQSGSGVTSDAQRLVALLEGHTDEHLAQLAAAGFGSPGSAVPADPARPAGGA